MFLSWFDAKDAKDFGLALAKFYIERQIKLPANVKSKLVEKRQIEILEKMSDKINLFKHNKSLNFYTKAQAINVFKWSLMDAGLDRQVVEDLCNWVVRKI